MGKLASIRRRMETTPAVRVSIGEGLSPKDLESLTFDAEDETLSADFLIPIQDGRDYATYTYLVDCDGRGSAPPGVVAALRQLIQAVSTAASHAQRAPDEGTAYPCATCTSACCRDTVIRLLPGDLKRLTENGVDTAPIERFDAPSPQGYIAAIDASSGACPYLSADGCTIYNLRPTICREYSAWTCSAFEEDSDKVSGKRKLLVVPSS